MDDAAFDLLRQLVSDAGRDMTCDSRRCEALLRDRFGDRLRREQAVLVAAVRTHAAAALATQDPRVDATPLVEKLARRLHEDECIEQAPARWAVEAWALALGVACRRDTRPADRPVKQPEPPRLHRAPPPRHVAAAPPLPRGSTSHGGRFVLLGTLGLLAAIWLARPASHVQAAAQAAPEPSYLSAPATGTATMPLAPAPRAGLVGIVMTRDEGAPFVVVRDTLAGSAAARAGIAPGSRILRVNGQSARARSPAEIAQTVRGPIGSSVRLDVALPGAPTRSLELMRR